MANLKTLLRSTAFFKINSRHSEHDAGETITMGTQTWRFSASLSGGPVVRDLECYTDSGTWATVLEQMQWSDPVVATDFFQGIQLPLKKEFIISVLSARSGSIQDDPSFLDEYAESSLQIVYGFQYFPLDKIIRPLVKDHADISDCLAKDDFFSLYSEELPPFEAREVDRNKKLIVQVRAVKFLFAIELICCSANTKFEPTGAGRVARYYPRSYLIGNIPFSVNDATTQMMRPMHAHHSDHDHSEIPPDQRDGSTHDYHCGYYADSNFWPLTHGNIPPKWPNFFSYYSYDDRKRHHVVKSTALRERTDSSNLMVFVDSTVTHYEYSTVMKVPRQGAFDNLHIAPAMIAPEVIRKKRQAVNPDGAWNTLDMIFMAPICQHDCLHMHWRWGAAYSEAKHLKGWDANGAYQKMGAPMIPLNQDLYIVFPQNREMHYTVEISKNADPMRWQVMMDHGAGYMVGLVKEIDYFDFQRLGVEVVLKATTLGTSDVEPLVNCYSWAMFYWNMRYINLVSLHGGQIPPAERLLFSKAQLQALIDL